MVQTTPGNVKHFQGREANREQKTPIRQQKACSPKAKASIPDRLSSLVKDSSSDGSAASRVSEMRLRGSCLMYVQDREMSASCASPTPATSDSTSDDAVGSLALGTAVDTAATDLDSSSSESWSSCPAWGCIMPIIGAPIGSPISIIWGTICPETSKASSPTCCWPTNLLVDPVHHRHAADCTPTCYNRLVRRQMPMVIQSQV